MSRIGLCACFAFNLIVCHGEGFVVCLSFTVSGFDYEYRSQRARRHCDRRRGRGAPNDSAQGMHEIGRATAHLTES